MLTITDIAEELQEEEILEDFFSEDTHESKLAYVKGFEDLHVAIYVEVNEIHLSFYSYEDDEEEKLILVENEDDMADLNPQIVSALEWYITDKDRDFKPRTVTEIKELITTLTGKGIYMDNFNPVNP